MCRFPQRIEEKAKTQVSSTLIDLQITCLNSPQLSSATWLFTLADIWFISCLLFGFLLTAMLLLGSYLGYLFVERIHMPLLAHLWLVILIERFNTYITSSCRCALQCKRICIMPFSFNRTIMIDDGFIIFAFS